MNPSTSTRTRAIGAALFAAAMLFFQLSARAVIVGPYTADANTLHLWHLDETSTPCIDSAFSGGTNCVGLFNGATLGNASFTGFGNALNTLDGGQNGVAAANKDALLSPSTANPPVNIASFTYANSSSGAFTYEAIVWIGFDPTLNLGTTANGGNNRGSPCEILTCESGVNANRLFQFRIFPKGNTLISGGTGTVIATNGPFLTFENVRATSAGQPTIYAPIPMSGPDAILSNNWYHVAVTYNGVPNTANNIKFYWTLMDPSRAVANQIAITSVQATSSGPNPLFSSAAAPVIGNLARLTSGSPNGNFLGLIDEMRISNIERGAGQMMFSAAVVGIVTQPASQFVAAGDNVLLSVSASGQALRYQWQFYGTNLPSATNSTLVLSNITFSQAGPYQVIVTNSAPSGTNSTVATITVGSLFGELFNSGLNGNRTLLSGGDVDPHWQLVYSDDPGYPGPAAVVVGAPPGTYLPNGPSSMWLAPVASGNALSGLFNYRTTFILDTTDPASAVLNGGWAMDNNGWDILLNGVSVGLTTAGFGGLTPFTITNGYVHAGTDTNGDPISITNYFVPGLNTLECVISNAPSTGGANPTGLRVEVRGVALPLPSTAPYFTSLPSNVTTQLQQSATFSAVAVGSGPLTYQWYRGVTLLAGQTRRTLALSAVGAGDAGTYTLWVTNSAGFTNATATLTIITPPALAWLGIDTSNPTFWDTVTVNWLNTGSSSDVAFAPEDDVLFDSRGSSQPNVDLVQPLTPNSITVDSATDYTLMSSGGLGAIYGSVPLTKKNGGILILDVTNNSSAPVTILGGTVQVGNNDANGSLGSGAVSNNGAITFARSDAFAVPNTLSGTGAVTMAGSGTAAVSGHNTYTGPTVITAGTLSANNNAAIGSTVSGTTVQSGGQLFIYGDVTLDPEPLVLSGSGPGTGALHKGAGAATTFGGAITLAADAMINLDNTATLNLTNAAGIAGTDVNLDLNGGTSSQGSVSGSVTLGIGGLTKDGAGTWTLTATNNNWSGGITVNGGTLQIGTGITNGSFGTGPINVNAGTLAFNSALPLTLTNNILDSGMLAITGPGNAVLSGQILDDGALVITGPANVLLSGEIDGGGTLTNYSGTITLTSSNYYVGTSGTVTLSSSNTYSGITMIRGAGIVRATASSALGTGTCIIGGGQTDVSRLELAGGIILSNPIAIFPRIFFGTASGNTDVAADILNVSGTNILSPPSSITIGIGGNNLTLESASGDLILAAGITAAGGGRHVVLRGAGSGEIQGALDYTGSNSEYIWKLDSGTWTLWGTNSPGAATTISNGVLVLNGSLDNVLTNAGGTLAGTGLLSGPVYINTGATLAPGSSIGTMTINNTLTLQPGSTTSMELNKSVGASDQVVGLTSVTYGGTLVLSNLSGTLAAGDVFTLFSAASYSGAFARVSPSSPGAGLIWGTNTLALNGTLRIQPAVSSRPTISSSAYDGSTLVMSGANGPANGGYAVVSSTNVAAPLTNWSVAGFGAFDASGNFSFTNTVSSDTPKIFFRLRVP